MSTLASASWSSWLQGLLSVAHRQQSSTIRSSLSLPGHCSQFRWPCYGHCWGLNGTWYFHGISWHQNHCPGDAFVRRKKDRLVGQRPCPSREERNESFCPRLLDLSYKKSYFFLMFFRAREYWYIQHIDLLCYIRTIHAGLCMHHDCT